MPGSFSCIIPCMGMGGAERVASNVLSLFPDCRRGLFTFKVGSEYPVDVPHRVIGGDFLASGPVAPRALMAARAFADVARMKRAERFDSHLSFLPYPNIITALTPGPGRRVLSVHSVDSVNLKGRTAPVVHRALRSAYQRADQIVAVSEAVAEDLRTYYRAPSERIEVIPNGVDVDAIRRAAAQPIPQALERVFREPTLLAVGRLIEAKGTWHLIRILAELRRRGDEDIRLVLVGDGPLRAKLEALTADLGLKPWKAGEPSGPAHEADVLFLGTTTNPFRYMRAATVFCLPSLWEGFGNVVVEALACGANIVAADCGTGPRSILGARSDGPVVRAPERLAGGVLMPVLNGVESFNTSPTTSVELDWASVLREALTPRRRLDVDALLQPFELAEQREHWARALSCD